MNMKPALNLRLSKAQIMAIAENLHHDECGIEAMFTAMKQADNPRVAYNVAWVLSHLSKEDKMIYLFRTTGSWSIWQHPQNFVFVVG